MPSKDIDEYLVHQLKERIEFEIRSMNETNLLVILQSTFNFVTLNELRSIPFAVLKRLSYNLDMKLPEDIIRSLIRSDILPDIPLIFRRQAWQLDSSIFFNHIHQDVKNYCTNCNRDSVKDICDKIGSNSGLFVKFANYCSELSIQKEIANAGSIIIAVLNYHLDSNQKIKSFESLHDVASIIRIWDRKNEIDTVNDIINIIIATIIGQAAPYERVRAKHEQNKQEKKFKESAIVVPIPPPTIKQHSSPLKFKFKRKFVDNESSNQNIEKMDSMKKAFQTVDSDSTKNQLLQVLLVECLSQLNKMDNLKIFASKVTDAIAPNYSKIIKRPIDLTMIHNKINSSKYKSLRGLNSDVELMFQNCRKYNGRLSPYYAYAVKLSKQWETIFAEKLSKIHEEPKTTNQAIKSETDIITLEIVAETEKISDAKLFYASKLEPFILQLSNNPSQFNGQDDLNALLQLVVEYLILLDANQWFLNKMIDRDAPNYSMIISTPIKSLNAIKSKASHREYQDLTMFDQDVSLLVDNCRVYNGQSSKIFQMASDLEAAWKEIKSKLQFLSLTNKESSNDTKESPMIQSQPLQDNPENSNDKNNELPIGIPDPISVKIGEEKEKLSQKDHPIDRYKSSGDFIQLPRILSFNSIWNQIQQLNLPGVSTSAESDGNADIVAALPQLQLLLNESKTTYSAVLRNILNEAWEYLSEIDSSGFFAMPVAFSEYHEVVENPMDLSSIKVALDRKKYKTLEEFDLDVNTMINNCLSYNEDFSEVYKAAEQIRLGWSYTKHNISLVLMNGDVKTEVKLPQKHFKIESSKVGKEESSSQINLPKQFIDTTNQQKIKKKRKLESFGTSKVNEGITLATPDPMIVSEIYRLEENGASNKITELASSTILAAETLRKEKNYSSIPGVPAEGKLLWITTMLRDPTPQNLLIRYLSSLLHQLFQNNSVLPSIVNLKKSGILDNQIKLIGSGIGIGIKMPSEIPLIRQIVQLCQLRLIKTNEFPSLDEILLRRLIPHLVLLIAGFTLMKKKRRAFFETNDVADETKLLEEYEKIFISLPSIIAVLRKLINVSNEKEILDQLVDHTYDTYYVHNEDIGENIRYKAFLSQLASELMISFNSK